MPEKLGVLMNDSRAFPGYNLINPGRKKTYLYDNEGRVVHSWTSELFQRGRSLLARKWSSLSSRRGGQSQARLPGPGRRRSHFKNSTGTAISSGISSITAKSACPTMTRSSSPTETLCSSAGR